MRQIGSTTDSKLTQKFADFLRAEGIACTIDREGDGFRIWIHDDDRVAAAKEELQRFMADPNDARYKDAEARSLAKLRENMQRQKSSRQQVVRMSEKWDQPVVQSCPLTVGLIVASIVVAVLTQLNPKHGDPRVDLLWISLDRSLDLVMHGEVWRLITPIFLHFGPMHLLFNLMGMQSFGFPVENRIGTFRYLMMVLVIAVISNYLEFRFVTSGFGGMSGVVYGLFGYMWIRGRLEPGTGFDLSNQSIFMMLLWHVLCVLEVVPNIANWAHGGGLVTGMALAAIRWLVVVVRRRL